MFLSIRTDVDARFVEEFDLFEGVNVFFLVDGQLEESSSVEEQLLPLLVESRVSVIVFRDHVGGIPKTAGELVKVTVGGRGGGGGNEDGDVL